MKCLYKLGITVLLLAGFALIGCAKELTQNDLMYHNFVLTEINGKPFEGEKIPNLAFNEGFRVSGSICNSYTGQGEMVGDILYVRSMAMTKMLCADQNLNDLEFTFANMLMTGAILIYEADFWTLEYEEPGLILEGEGTRLTFELRDYVN